MAVKLAQSGRPIRIYGHSRLLRFPYQLENATAVSGNPKFGNYWVAEFGKSATREAQISDTALLAEDTQKGSRTRDNAAECIQLFKVSRNVESRLSSPLCLDGEVKTISLYFKIQLLVVTIWGFRQPGAWNLTLYCKASRRQNAEHRLIQDILTKCFVHLASRKVAYVTREATFDARQHIFRVRSAIARVHRYTAFYVAQLN
jgi:hypothetical protein